MPTPESQLTQRLPLLVTIVLLPFNVAYSIFSRIFSTIAWAFPILPRILNRIYSTQANGSARYAGRKPLSPRDTAARFIREFEEDYADTPGLIPFQECGYAQAFDVAKRDLKYFMIILLSPEHDDTAPFARDTLLSAEFTDFLKSRQSDMIIWGGSVQDSEAYQVANAINVTKFPFIGLIVHTPSVSATAMSVIARIPGPTPASDLITRLQKAMDARTEELAQARAVRADRQAAASIRDQTDSAYERSLAADRERARQRREAAAAQEQAEREAREREAAKTSHAEKLAQWKQWRASSIPGEPSAEIKDVVRISLRLPSGERVVRRFLADADMEELYAFVECYDILQSEGKTDANRDEPKNFVHEYSFRLVSPMPREAYDLEDGGTIGGRIGRSGNLIVERIQEVDDEDGAE